MSVAAIFAIAVLQIEERCVLRHHGQSLSHRWNWKSCALRLLMAPWVAVSVATLVYWMTWFGATTWEQAQSQNWPTTRAQITKCELSTGWLFDLEYEYSVDNHTFIGNRDNAYGDKNGLAVALGPVERIEQLTGPDYALVSYNTAAPKQSLLTVGWDADWVLFSFLGGLKFFGTATLSFAWLFVVRRRLLDDKSTIRQMSPNWIAISSCTFVAYFVGYAHLLFFAVMPYGWVLSSGLVVVSCILIYRKVLADFMLDIKRKHEAGRILVIGNQPQPY